MKNTKLYTRTTRCILCFCLFLLTTYTQTLKAQGGAILGTIDLVEFTGEKKGTCIVLNWAIAYAFGSNEIKVQRADESGVFIDLGKSSSAGVFTDLSPKEKVNYYRLLTKNELGELIYSKTLAVEFNVSMELKLAPNPAKNYTTVSFAMEENSSAVIEIMDGQGNLVTQQEIESLYGGYQQTEIDVENMTPGVYILRVVQGPEATMRRLVVL